MQLSLQKSIFWTIMQFFAVFIVELAGVAILARILNPEEMGWYALAFAVIRFGQFLGGFGLFAVILRSETMEHTDRARVLGLALIASSIATLILFVLAFIASPGVIGAVPQALLQIMAPLVFINSFGMISTALMTRDLRFRDLLFLRLSGAIIFLAVAIPMATASMGAYSLAVGYAASTAIYALLAALATSGAFLLQPSLVNIRTTLTFSTTIFSSTVLFETAEAILPNIVGRMLGFDSLGLFSRARELVLKANTAIQDAVMPALMPHVFQIERDGAALRQGFLLGLCNLTAISLPLAGLVALLAKPLVSLLLGPQWGAVPSILAVLSLGLGLMPLRGLSRIFALALRKERALLWCSVTQFVGIITIVPLCTMRGLEAVAVGIVSLQGLMLILHVAIVRGRLNLSVSDIVRAIRPSLLVLMTCLTPVIAAQQFLPMSDLPAVVQIMVQGSLASAGWGIGIFGLRHPLRTELIEAANGLFIRKVRM